MICLAVFAFVVMPLVLVAQTWLFCLREDQKNRLIRAQELAIEQAYLSSEAVTKKLNQSKEDYRAEIDRLNKTIEPAEAERRRAVALMGDTLGVLLERFNYGCPRGDDENRGFRELCNGVIRVMDENRQSFIVAMTSPVVSIEPGSSFRPGRLREFAMFRLSFSFAMSEETPRNLVAEQVAARVKQAVSSYKLTQPHLA